MVLPQRWTMRDGEQGDAELCETTLISLAHSRGKDGALTGRTVIEDLLHSESDGTRALVENGVLRPRKEGSAVALEKKCSRELTLGQW